MKRIFYVVLTAVLLASFVLTACGTPATEEAPVEPEAPEATEAPAATEVPAEPKVAVGAWSQEPDNIIPYYTNMSYAWWIAQLTMVGLAEWDDQGNYVPELAAEILRRMDEGTAPLNLLHDRALREQLQRHAADDARARLDRLVAALPTEDPSLAKLLEDRRAGFASAKTDRPHGRDGAPCGKRSGVVRCHLSRRA